MDKANPVSIPPVGHGSGLRRLIDLAPDCGRAMVHLARARIKHHALRTSEILQLNEHALATGRPFHACSEADIRQIERISFVIPRIAARVPWRSDCLIQAMAAQQWLLSKGIASTIVIGVDRSDKTEFAAHAWLRCGDRIVTGGEVANFKILLETVNESE